MTIRDILKQHFAKEKGSLSHLDMDEDREWTRLESACERLAERIENGYEEAGESDYIDIIDECQAWLTEPD